MTRAPIETNVVRTPLGYYRINPLPSEDELAAYYSKKYYTSVKPEMYRKGDPDEMRWVARMNRWAADDFLRLKPAATATLGFLDVGCGPGYLLAEMHRRNLPVTGIDPDSDAAVHYNPQVASRVRKGTAQSLPLNNGERYDWISLAHVLEHVRDPERTLASLKERLTAGGILRVTVPNDFSLFQTAAESSGRIQRRFWVCPPDHLNYFSLNSLTRLLESCGFRVLYRHGDFPIDMFLLMGRDYTSDPALGKTCHFERMRFEEALEDAELRRVYETFAELGIGRNLIVYAGI